MIANDLIRAGVALAFVLTIHQPRPACHSALELKSYKLKCPILCRPCDRVAAHSQPPVEEAEVIDVLESPGEDRSGREGSRIALGRTASGRYLRVIYAGPCSGLSICDHGLRDHRETPGGVSPAPKEETPMSQDKFPEGWDEGRVQRVLAHYQEQTEDGALADDEAGIESSETVMNVPRALVPKVRELIAKSQG